MLWFWNQRTAVSRKSVLQFSKHHQLF